VFQRTHSILKISIFKVKYTDIYQLLLEKCSICKFIKSVNRKQKSV
jgi:hypothetical protein